MRQPSVLCGGRDGERAFFDAGGRWGRKGRWEVKRLIRVRYWSISEWFFLPSVILGLDPRIHATRHTLSSSLHPHDIFPAPQTCAYNPLIPPRIHCQAWQRDGIGAMCGEETQDLTHRACGKWSPSGDMGEAMGCRTDPVVSCLKRRAGCACAAHKEAGTGGCVGIVRRTGTRGKAKTFRRGRQSVRSRCQNSDEPSGNRRTTSTIPAFAEGSESQAKTAERGAERCHIQYIKRGSFQRPVRNAL